MTPTHHSTSRHGTPGLGFALAALALAMSAGAAAADWPAGGVKLCGRLTYEMSPSIAATSDGGAIVAWMDTRARTEIDIYAQRIDPGGVIQWGTNGVPVCLASNDQYNPLVASDGSGGAIIVWLDRRQASARMGIYAQHLLADGSVAPGWPANGLAVCDSTFNPLTPYRIAQDGQGGLFVAWSDSGLASLPGVDIKVQRITPSGIAAGWPAGGVRAAPATTDQSEPAITADGSGGVLVAWNDATTVYLQSNIIAQHLDASGARAAGWPAVGVTVSNAVNGQFAPRVAGDGAGGCFVAWLDRRSGTGEELYAQRMNASGAALWAANGVTFSSPVSGLGAPVVAADGAGGVVIGWMQPVPIGGGQFRYDLMAQRVAPSGALVTGWPVGGVAACTGQQGSRSLTALVVDAVHPGRAILGWNDSRPGAPGVYRAVLDEQGAPAAGEQSNGRPLIGTTAPQSSPYAAAAPQGGAIMVLLKMVPNSDLYSDPYAQRVIADGLVGVEESAPLAHELAIASISPNPSPGIMRVRARWPASGPATITLLDLAGRVRAWRELSPGGYGEQDVTLDAARPLEAGVYVVRITQGGASAARRVAVVH